MRYLPFSALQLPIQYSSPFVFSGLRGEPGVSGESKGSENDIEAEISGDSCDS